MKSKLFENILNGIDVKTNVPIELNSVFDISEFMEAIQDIEHNIYIFGYDEGGGECILSPTSLLGITYLSSICKNNNSKVKNSDKFDGIDWNTIRIVSDGDIYSKVSKFVKSGSPSPLD